MIWLPEDAECAQPRVFRRWQGSEADSWSRRSWRGRPGLRGQGCEVRGPGGAGHGQCEMYSRGMVFGILRIVNGCCNSSCGLLASLSGSVSCASGIVEESSFASQATMDRCTMRRCTTGNAELSVMPWNLSACFTSFHLFTYILVRF